MKPHEIEQESFAIIDAEAGAHGFSSDQWAIVRRMIHTSADFDYVADVRIHPRAVAAGVDAIRSGATIFTDTNMARTGIRRKDLAHFGAAVRCLMADEALARKAVEQGITRARAAVEAVAHQLEGCIYVVGNAPTALLHLVELIRNQKARPALVIGLPVGFVNAAESKAKLLDLDIPYITNAGRKGGSNVAASAVNALILLAGQAG
ncbi:MAG: precorrin-8X methylmutase [Desulfobacteraceae bacterium]|jgi:precorrin-8X/cobalt-precorrin-8 methylmutase